MIAITQNRIAVVLALGVPCAVALWIVAARTDAFPSTLVFVALLFSAMGLVGLNTWYNSRATGSLAQVIHEADITAGAPEETVIKSSHEQQHTRR